MDFKRHQLTKTRTTFFLFLVSLSSFNCSWVCLDNAYSLCHALCLSIWLRLGSRHLRHTNTRTETRIRMNTRINGKRQRQEAEVKKERGGDTERDKYKHKRQFWPSSSRIPLTVFVSGAKPVRDVGDSGRSIAGSRRGWCDVMWCDDTPLTTTTTAPLTTTEEILADTGIILSGTRQH